MAKRKLEVAIVGAGMGGLAAAATLRRVGIDAHIYEQAPEFTRLGAGIQQSPNSIKVLRALGLEARLRQMAFEPQSTTYREAVSGKLLWEKKQGRVFEEKFGAPHLLLHRADLHATLASIVPDEVVHRSKKLVSFSQAAGRVTLRFTDGSTAEADAMIAADGVHSLVREAMLGPDKPRWTGRIAFRTVFAASLLGDLEIEDCCKWMAADRHIVVYYTNPRRDEVYFVTSTPEPGFDIESWSSKGDMGELRAAYRDFHPTVRAVLEACPEAHKWALVERDPLPRWCDGAVALLGDACHPMTPYMAQGAASAIEDAAVLARCLDGVDPDGVHHALRTYEATRKPRTSHIQVISSLNNIARFKGEQENVYAHDVMTAPLVDPDAAPTHTGGARTAQAQLGETR